jgi:hypothetical protein
MNQHYFEIKTDYNTFYNQISDVSIFSSFIVVCVKRTFIGTWLK